jgi:predicted transposase YdaD
VDADRPLKELFRLRPRDLLALTGDAGAVLVSTQVAEVQSLTRRVDTVLRLRRGRQRYIRHLEFQMTYSKGLELRCFEYATRLVIRFREPVLTTVVLVEGLAPRELAYREVLGGRVVHERRFDSVRLWEMDPARLLRLGPGGAALIGSADKTTLSLIGRAASRIQRATRGMARSDLLFILQALSQRRYTADELAGVIPRETVMASSLWAEAVSQGRREGRQKGRQEGRQEGRAEGAVAEARDFCAELARQLHPAVADRVVPLIEACSDVARLHQWGLQASKLSDAEFLRLVTQTPESTSRPSGRGRTPRPSRKAKRSGWGR